MSRSRRWCGWRARAAASAPGAPDGSDAAAGSLGPSTRVLELDRQGRGSEPSTAPLPRELGFELLDAGAAPRAPRRYRLTATAARTMTAELTLTSRALRDGVWSERLTLPVIAQPLAVQPDAAGTRLQLRAVTATLADGGTEPARRAATGQTERWRNQLERRRVDAPVDDRGRIAALAFADLPGEAGTPSPTASPARDELWQYLLGLAVPLPAEPIGVGARWKVTTLLRAGTATVTQTAEFTLTAIDGDTWSVAVRSRRIGERQLIAAGSLPAGSRIELVGLFREVSGAVTLGPADPLPIAGELGLEVRTHARITVPGEPTVEVASEDVGTVRLK